MVLRLQRKEVENYLLESNAIVQTAKELADKREQYTGASAKYPSDEEIQSEIRKTLDSPDICNTVKFQVVPKHRETLGDHLDPSTKERKGEEWFSAMWSDEDWRLRNCPGKEVLARLRVWCQRDYSLTLPTSRLAMKLQQYPGDIQEIMEKLQKYFYS